jgi:hypothetical protein
LTCIDKYCIIIKTEEGFEMPCYITYRAYATIKDSDYASFLDAVRSLGYRVSTLGSVIELDGGRVTLNQAGSGYELVGDKTLCGRFLQEHKLRKAEKDARKRGQRTKRQVQSNGEIALEIA